MIKRVFSKKLASKRGFSLTELLVVLVIMSMTSLAIGIGISSAATAYKNVKAATESSILCSTLVTELSDTLRYATDISSGGGNAVFTHRRYGVDVSVGASSDGKRVLVGTEPVLGESAYSQLTAEAKVTYDGALFTLAITVYDFDGKTKLQDLTLKIAPLAS